MQTKVITYQNPNGATIDLTAKQVDLLESAGTWPRNQGGEFCSVSHGWHRGVPTWTDEQLNTIVGNPHPRAWPIPDCTITNMAPPGFSPTITADQSGPCDLKQR